MKGTHASSWAVLYIMFFSTSVYFECAKGPSSSNPEEHQLRSSLWPVLHGFLDGRFLDGIIRIRIRVLGLLGGLSLVRLFGLWGNSGFLRRCGGPGFVRLPIRGQNGHFFWGGGGKPEGNTFEGAVFNALSGSSSNSSDWAAVKVWEVL